MDNLAHSLMGVVLSRAGLNRWTPQAGWTIVLAANAPDLDILAGLGSGIEYVERHRGWTHSLAGAPLVALVPLCLWIVLTRTLQRTPRQWIGAYAASLVGVLFHLGMDWLNIYGIRLLLPFRSTWLRLDLVHVVDIWMWAILFIAIAAPWLARLVNSEIGAKPGSGRGAAWASLILLTAYLGFRIHVHDEALRILDSRTNFDNPVLQAAVFPNSLNPWQWTGLVETGEFYRVSEIKLWRDFDPDQGRTLYKPAQSPEMDVARQTRTVQGFLKFAQFPIWRILPSGDGKSGFDVQVSDLRFGLPEDRRFSVFVRLDANRRVLQESFSFGNVPYPK